jgi:hypothetical protein
MSSRFDSIFEHASSLASIAAALLAVAASAFGLATMLHAQELFFSVGSLLVIASLGAFSLYIARGAKSLTRRPRIFLSYSRDNARQASMLRDALSKEGAYVWFDETDLRAGDDIKATVEAAIENSNTVVLMLSRSLGPHIKWELDAARTKHVPILAVLGPDIEPPPELTEARSLTLNTDGSNLGEIAAAAMQVGKHEVGRKPDHVRNS